MTPFEHHRKLRLEVLEAYGSKCECCGETQKVFLSLDIYIYHKNNDGAHHRREQNGSNSGCSNSIWYSLKRQGWPKENFRLLCYNCNLGRHRNWDHRGICPHEIQRGEIVSVALALENL